MTVNEICTNALSNLGISLTVTSITAPTNKEERALAKHYAPAKRALLGKLKWPFANRFADLLVDLTSTSTKYAYAYELPDDVVKTRAINPVRGELPRTVYAIGVDADGEASRLYTDASPAQLEYTAYVSESLFTQEFSDALAWELAVRVASELRINPTTFALAKKMADIMYQSAAAAALQEDEPDAPPEASYIRDRS